MSEKQRLLNLLRSTIDVIELAAAHIPPGRSALRPPHSQHPNSDRGFKTYFGDWSAMRILFHLVFYEETYALPALGYWQEGQYPQRDLLFPDPILEESEWHGWRDRASSMDALLARFQEVRRQQIGILSDVSENAWGKAYDHRGLGKIDLYFVAAKTIQHTLEHGDDLLKNALYWERALAWLDAQG